MSLLRSLILAALFVAPVQAESGLSGHITQNSSGDPLPGANVVVVGTRIGAIADARGHFKLQGFESYPVLIRASMVGFKAVELRVESEKDVLIGLEQTTDALQRGTIPTFDPQPVPAMSRPTPTQPPPKRPTKGPGRLCRCSTP